MSARRSTQSRRTVMKAGAVGALGLAGAVALEGSPATAAADGYLVGRGIADATGEVAEVGMMGYGRIDQQAAGLHTRLRARAFVVVAPRSDRRVLLVVVDCAMIFESVRQKVVKRLVQKYGRLYHDGNVLITATHSHSGPGGYAHHLLYNLTTLGFHRKTFDAMVEGIVEAVRQAHDDTAPSDLVLSHGRLTGASINRSRAAFDRNPEADRRHFPNAVDPQSTLLRIERHGRPVGAVNWFPVHGTSMSGENRLISGDNKGFAAYHWEHEVHDVAYRSPDTPDFVAAFAQTNSGDMSPNLDLKPPTTPQDFANTQASGLRQYEAAAAQLHRPGTRLTGVVDSRLVYIDLSRMTVRPEFTGDGRVHRTSKPCIGASMAAGSVEDGPAFPGLEEGENSFWDTVSDSLIYEASPDLEAAQSPKDILAPIGEANRLYPWVQERVPVMLVRIGRLYLIGIPGEVTVCAGLRLRRTVASVVGAEVEDVLVAGYANAYFHYLTTPEEYDAQHYEGGSTLFGRWQLPALQQTAHELAVSLRDGTPLPMGPPSPDLSGEVLSMQLGVVVDVPQFFTSFGDILVRPRESYRAGERVEVVFAGAHPSNDLRRGRTYLEVQRREATGTWRTVADDGDWATRFHWEREGLAASRVTITWDIWRGIAPGLYRIVYHGDSKSVTGTVTPFDGTSPAFSVR
ncbi:alkaline ceramidase [Streptomyces sp. CB02009]|uniref:neutral/alkaline ceramidase n=1 Tax=Streptomyces sp. CB02009 TaxID=1703938 RepID=UPI00093F59C7|nr:neutral/alkaline ceramidase [Streptomyces sp. CB02009]OKJ49515.1 alkaline ceramidase [Streptomyces sp. CB02009]